MKEWKKIYQAIIECNVWELKRIFTIVGPSLVNRYINRFWIDNKDNDNDNDNDNQYQGKTLLCRY